MNVGHVCSRAIKESDIQERHPYDSTTEAIERGIVTRGQYSPPQGTITMYTTAFNSDEQRSGVLRHEILGHYGIDTFTPIEKRIVPING